MTIAVYNNKGGVGKTSLSYSLAKDLNMFYISNDDSAVDRIYKDKAMIMKHPKFIENCVYDFGGFIDVHILEIINKCDYVIVPLASDVNSFIKTINTIKEIQNTNIILVANRSQKDDFQEIKETLNDICDYPIIEIKESRIWSKTFKEEMSVSEIEKSSPLNKHIYKNSLKGYKQLLKAIKG